LLPPLFRIRRDGRAIARHRNADPVLARQLVHWQPTSVEDLRAARDAGRLFASADEGFIARRRLIRQIGDVEYRASEFLYSPHQMLKSPDDRARASAPQICTRWPPGHRPGRVPALARVRSCAGSTVHADHHRCQRSGAPLLPTGPTEAHVQRHHAVR
jgi:hypothetical protein